jgi:hypothetical protein
MNKYKADHDRVLSSVTGISSKDLTVIKDEVSAAYHRQLQAEIKACEKDKEAAVAKALSTFQKDGLHKLHDVEKRLSAVTCERDTLKEQLRLSTESAQCTQIEAFKKQIEQQCKQLELFQKSNMGKGHRGENAVAAILKRTFTTHEIDIKGGGNDPHATDIWIKDGDGKIIAVEVKNKDTVTKSDIDKLYRDIDDMVSLHRPVIGGVLVSVASKNIPKKGAMHFEMHNKLPILFLGFDNDMELDSLLPSYMKMIMTLCTYDSRPSDMSVEKIIEKITPLLSEIKRLHKNTSTLRTQVTAVLETVKGNELSVRTLLKIIEGVLPNERAYETPVYKHESVFIKPETKLVKSDKGPKYQCDTCALPYKTDTGLVRHYMNYPAHKKS